MGVQWEASIVWNNWTPARDQTEARCTENSIVLWLLPAPLAVLSRCLPPSTGLCRTWLPEPGLFFSPCPSPTPLRPEPHLAPPCHSLPAYPIPTCTSPSTACLPTRVSSLCRTFSACPVCLARSSLSHLQLNVSLRSGKFLNSFIGLCMFKV